MCTLEARSRLHMHGAVAYDHSATFSSGRRRGDGCASISGGIEFRRQTTVELQGLRQRSLPAVADFALPSALGKGLRFDTEIGD